MARWVEYPLPGTADKLAGAYGMDFLRTLVKEMVGMAWLGEGQLKAPLKAVWICWLGHSTWSSINDLAADCCFPIAWTLAAATTTQRLSYGVRTSLGACGFSKGTLQDCCAGRVLYGNQEDRSR
jgi:hypothetical protein